MAGYRIELVGLACMSAMSCGPVAEPPVGESSGDESQGYPLTSGNGTTTAATTGELDSSATASTTGDSGTSSSGEPGTTTGDALACEIRGEICDEFLVCDCSCDASPDCCFCEPAVCTSDRHCEPDHVCTDVGKGYRLDMQCVPSECLAPRDVLVATQQEVASLAGVVCTASLTILGPAITDLTPLESLDSVAGELRIEGTSATTLSGLGGLAEVETLVISDNGSLTSVAVLAGLYIDQGGTIRDNASLPGADVHDMLAMTSGGELVEVCGNLDDVPCP